MAPITVCIDTNSINIKQRNPHLNRLEQWSDIGMIEIRRTSALMQELSRNVGRVGEARRQKAAGYKEGRDSKAFSTRLSGLRGGDSLRGPSAFQWVPAISEILFPGRPFEDLSERDQGDVLHLATHKLHEWDYFVSLDRGDIVRNRQRLADELAIAVLSPEQAVIEIAAVVARWLFG